MLIPRDVSESFTGTLEREEAEADSMLAVWTAAGSCEASAEDHFSERGLSWTRN